NGSTVSLDLHGGNGKDTESIMASSQATGATINLGTGTDNLFQVDVSGGNGKDSITFDNSLVPFDFGSSNGEVKLDLDGGNGKDTINVLLANNASTGQANTPQYDVKVHGGNGKDDLNFQLMDGANGGLLGGMLNTFLVDGGRGKNSGTIVPPSANYSFDPQPASPVHHHGHHED